MSSFPTLEPQLINSVPTRVLRVSQPPKAPRVVEVQLLEVPVVLEVLVVLEDQQVAVKQLLVVLQGPGRVQVLDQALDQAPALYRHLQQTLLLPAPQLPLVVPQGQAPVQTMVCPPLLLARVPVLQPHLPLPPRHLRPPTPPHHLPLPQPSLSQLLLHPPPRLPMAPHPVVVLTPRSQLQQHQQHRSPSHQPQRPLQ